MKIKLLAILLFFSLTSFAQKQKIWFDTDMGNEMDDIYALTRLLVEADKYRFVVV
jgi:purine nucleosidase